MNTPPDAPAEPVLPPAPAPVRPGRAARFVEWFWERRALREARAQALSPKEAGALLRARQAIALGELALEPGKPASQPADDLACGLFRQAVYWALLSRASRGTSSETAAPQLGELWRSADPACLARAAGGSALALELGDALLRRDFTGMAALPPPDQWRLARALRAFALELCDEADTVGRRIARIRSGRFLKLCLLSSLVLAVALVALAAIEWREKHGDLARGKPWTASSKYPEGGCKSPLQSCPESEMYFFCTDEQDNPWLEIDLQSVQKISRVRVYNREDCCGDRAVPMVIEVSRDHKRWDEVAKRGGNFSTWKAGFPATEARWVRLRVTRRSFLHLTGVRILP